MKLISGESSCLQDAQDIKDIQDNTFRENLENLVVEYILREERS
jgi:hypothetical protein